MGDVGELRPDGVPSVVIDGAQFGVGGTGLVEKAGSWRWLRLPVHDWLLGMGGVLAAAAVFLLMAHTPVPSEGNDLVLWVSQGRAQLMWSDEILFFAVVALGAGARGSLADHRTRRSTRVDVGMVSLMVGLVSLLVVLLAVGRLVYPAYGIALSADVVALLVSVTFGALHLALLAFAVTTVSLTWFVVPGPAKWPATIAGITIAAAFVAGSFPWFTPTWWNLLVAVLLAGWGFLIGSLRRSSDSVLPTAVAP
ncbi:hypothetical protein ABZ540_09620 [Nocardia xishanensis]|uniref:hypothetical protein n=1 Tax=Nocardia xishanensis TaxID=238964 RepID=UPI0033DA35EC